MRKFLLSLTILAGATLTLSTADARPAAPDFPGVQLIQYHGPGYGNRGRYHPSRHHYHRHHHGYRR